MTEQDELQEVLLELLTVAQQETFSGALLRQAGVRVIAATMMDALTVQLYSYLLVDKLLSDTTSVPFSTEVRVPRRLRDRLGLIFGKRTMRAEGHVQIKADYFQSFPESTVDYPYSLGKPVALARVTQDYEQDDDEAA